ncbi:MAG: hypothetical protein KC466_15160, partial [Myxococcales bacterium]|nr:hypothetical protein [Myxococcales bacterium]
PSIRLRILSALSLERPRGKSELERRLIEPLAERLFGDYPELEYTRDLRAGVLPPNVDVSEFYFSPGAFLGHEAAQERYVSANYTAVVRDLLSCGLNVLAQMIAIDTTGPEGPRYSLSSNTDVTLDLLPILAHRRGKGERIAFVAQTNRNLPFMGNDAVVPAEVFDGIVDNPSLDFRLFGPPSMSVGDADYAIAIHASALVRDGGTLQLGIGALGDAVTYMLCMRHEHNAAYRELLQATGALKYFGGPIECSGGMGPFREGLYGSTEMLVSGFLELRRAGILKREVYDDIDLQGLLNEGAIGETVTPETLEALVDRGAVGPVLTGADFARLQRLGVFRDGLRYEDGMLHLDAETVIPADLRDPAVFDAVARRGLGERLRGGRWLHAGFFVGPQRMYEELRAMDPAELDGINMTKISRVNSLFGDEMLRRVQRKDARFLNSGLIAT